MIAASAGSCKCAGRGVDVASSAAPPSTIAPPATSAATPATGSAPEITGGESDEVILFRSSDAVLPECHSSAVVLSHLTKLFSAVNCPEQNHTTAGRRRFVCNAGSFLITPRETPDGPGFELGLQVTGDVSVPRKALGDTQEAAWLTKCGIEFPPSLVGALTLWTYHHDSDCWNDATCPSYCRDTSKFFAAAKKAATTYGCKVNEDERFLFTCKKPSEHPTCVLNLDGEVSRFFLAERDLQHHRAFAITYRGNAVEACPGTNFGRARSEDNFFGSGFPNFLLQLRNGCRPRASVARPEE